MAEKKVATEEVAVDEAKAKRLAELNKRKSEIEQEYQNLKANVDETDALIKDLADRHARQREARNIYLARATELESEYQKVTTELAQLANEV